MASRKKKRNEMKRREKERERSRTLKPWAPLSGKPRPTAIIRTPEGEEKMSAVLMEFLEPYQDSWETEEQLHKLLSVGLVAWNAALMPPNEGRKLLEAVIEGLPADAHEDFLEIIANLMQRKLSRFAHNKRMIVDYHLTMQPSGPYLHVVSTLNALK